MAYPSVVAYLDSLPGGIDAHPESLLKADVFDYLRSSHPEFAADSGLSGVAGDVLAGRCDQTWIPEVVGNTIYLAARDAVFKSDAELVEWAEASNRVVFDKPGYRMLMRVLSPTLLVMGAAKRWGAFHRGSTLKATPASAYDGRMFLSGVLEFPPGLFDSTVLEILAAGFRVAISMGGAKEVMVKVGETTAARATFDVSWSS